MQNGDFFMTSNTCRSVRFDGYSFLYYMINKLEMPTAPF